jgi:hypothetical protein
MIVTVTNTASTAITFSKIALGHEDIQAFTESNDCTANLAPGASCTLTITFRPAKAGLHHGIVDIYDNGGGGEQNCESLRYDRLRQRASVVREAPPRPGASVRMPLYTPVVSARQGSFDSICHVLRAQQIPLKMTGLKRPSESNVAGGSTGRLHPRHRPCLARWRFAPGFRWGRRRFRWENLRSCRTGPPQPLCKLAASSTA